MGSSRRGGALLAAGLAASVGMFGFAGGSTAEAATVLTFSPLPQRMATALQGSACASPNECITVDYSANLATSVEHLTAAIADATAAETAGTGADDEVIVFGLSGGAGAAAEWMKYYADEIDAPSPEVLSFLVIGNPGRKYGGFSRRFAPMPETQYQVIDVAQQYDPIADRPDNPFNLLAQLNVALGFFSPLHTDYSSVDINDPNNIRWTEGNTTYVLVPTEKLPLLNPLRMFGLNGLADSLNAPLKAIVEQAYKRPASEPVEDPAALSQPAPELQADADDLNQSEEAGTPRASVQRSASVASVEAADTPEAPAARAQSNSIAEPVELTVDMADESDDADLLAGSSGISGGATEVGSGTVDSAGEPVDPDGGASLDIADLSAEATEETDPEADSSESNTVRRSLGNNDDTEKESSGAAETPRAATARGNSDTSSDGDSDAGSSAE